MKIWVKKTKDENGNYIDDKDVRYNVDWCIKVIYADGRTEEDLGYTRFNSLENALTLWGLSPYVEPDAETEEMTDL